VSTPTSILRTAHDGSLGLPIAFERNRHPDESRALRAHAPRWPSVASLAMLGALTTLVLLPRQDERGASQASLTGRGWSAPWASSSSRPDAPSISGQGKAAEGAAKAVAVSPRAPASGAAKTPSSRTAQQTPPAAPMSSMASIAAGIAAANAHRAAQRNDAALTVLQELTERFPEEAATWQALSDMAYELGRRTQAAGALERMQQLAPSAERQRQIVRRWRDAGDPVKETAALEALVQGRFDATPMDFELLAERHLEMLAPRRALATIELLATQRPEVINARVVALELRALVARSAENSKASSPPSEAVKGRANAATAAVPKAVPLAKIDADAALGRARSWLEQHPDTRGADAPLLSTALVNAGHPALAAAALEPFIAKGPGPVVQAWSQAMRSSGRGTEAASRLARLGLPRDDTQTVARERVQIALDGGRLDTALAVVKGSVDRTPATTKVSMARAALAELQKAPNRDATAVLRELWPKAQDELGANDPMLAARTAWATGDGLGAARWADAAQTSCEGNGNCAVALAALQLDLGRARESLSAVRLAERAGDIDESLLPRFARTALKLNVPVDALTKIEKQRRISPSSAFNEAWSLLATAAGQHVSVQRWVDTSRPGDIPELLLRELFRMAVDAKHNTLAVAVGLRLDARSLKPSERVLMAQMLMEGGRVSESLRLWKQARAQ
jgi:tetratricopeptide (TPR) repeat protein